MSVIAAWLRIKFKPFFYLAGYAGTGKTTLAIEISQMVEGKVRFAAFTGKAAKVMRSKGCKGASTIHQLIYHTEAVVDPVTGDESLATTKVNDEELRDVSLIIIDECSMVNEEIGMDLLSFEIPVLVLGDPAQLPPVSGGGFFTAGKPDFLLTEVHRQAAESQILRLATAIREGRWRPRPWHSDDLLVVDKANLNPSFVLDADMVLVGKNDTRRRYNERLRMRAGIKSTMPVKGEPIICLRNDQSTQVSNGEIFTIERLGKNKRKQLLMTLADPESSERRFVRVNPMFFADEESAGRLPMKDLYGTQQFTFAYAITCHKSQGSQWDKVCVFNEAFGNREDRARWLYTAVTRAAKHLTLVV